MVAQTHKNKQTVKGRCNAIGCFCFLQHLKRSSSLCSSMDSRVVGHNSIKHHICSDIVCPVRSFLHAHHSMYCERVVKHTWLWYPPAVIEHDLSPQTGAELPSQHNEVICSFMYYCLKQDSNPYRHYKCWTHFSLHHTVSPKLHSEQTQEKNKATRATQ